MEVKIKNSKVIRFEEIIEFIKEIFCKAKKEKAIIGISGGIDSALSLALTLKALGKGRVLPYFLPYGSLNPQGLINARRATSSLSIPDSFVSEIDIKPYVDAISIFDKTIDAGRKGNIMARVRMIILFDQAKKNNGLVIGTENKSEHLLGYYTRFGDEASDIEPLRGLYKTEVREMARELGVPQELIDALPTAGLWENQTDEGEFGFSYEEADKILHDYYDLKLGREEIIKKGFDPETVNNVVKRMEENSFKSVLPYTL